MVALCLFLNPERVLAASLTFKQALAMACRNNPDLQAEMDNAQAMRGYFIQSGLYPNPQLTVTAENFGGSGIYANDESAETTVAVALPIPLGHRLHYLKKASYADYLASLAQIKVRQTALYVAVGVAYVDVLYADQWQQVTKKLIQLNQDIVAAITRRVKAGAGAALDLRLAQIRLGEARIQGKRARRKALSQRARLERLLGVQHRLTQNLIDKGLPGIRLDWPFLIKKIPESPRLIQGRLQLQAKRAAIVAVKKSVWPDLTIQLGGRHFSDDGNNAAVMSAFAEVPVNNRNQGKIMTAEAQYTQTIHAIAALRLDVRQTLYNAFLQAQQNRDEADLVTDSLLPLAQKSIRLARDGYQMGRYSYIELSMALTTLYDEERHYQQAHARYHKAIIRIVGLLGLDPVGESK